MRGKDGLIGVEGENNGPGGVQLLWALSSCWKCSCGWFMFRGQHSEMFTMNILEAAYSIATVTSPTVDLYIYVFPAWAGSTLTVCIRCVWYRKLRKPV